MYKSFWVMLALALITGCAGETSNRLNESKNEQVQLLEQFNRDLQNKVFPTTPIQKFETAISVSKTSEGRLASGVGYVNSASSRVSVNADYLEVDGTFELVKVFVIADKLYNKTINESLAKKFEERKKLPRID